MTNTTSGGEADIGVESKEQAPIEPKSPDPAAKSRDEKKLAKATISLKAGDYQGVRALVSELTNSSDQQIVRAARDLKRRVDVDPVQIAVIVFCSAVFLGIVITYILR